MKLYFKQKFFSLRQRSEIYDEEGNAVFTALGEFLSLGRKMHLYDSSNTEVAFVQQRLLRLFERFSVYTDGQHIADIVKEFSFFKPRYRIEGLDWKIEGDLFSHDYTIQSGGDRIAYIHKRWMSFGDSYEIVIDSETDAVMVLAVIIAIDCVLDDSSSSASD